MNKHRYILEPYKGLTTRFDCPSCRKRHQFTRYIDVETGNYLAPNVGRCNRENNCRYHYTPKKYFEDNQLFNNYSLKTNQYHSGQRISQEIKRDTFIPNAIFEGSLKNHSENRFVVFLLDVFGSEATMDVIKKYFIGTAKHWNGATVFWQIDFYGRIRAGKIILYNSRTGRRVKVPFNHVSWAHSVLHINNFRLNQCLFGEHLLIDNPMKPVAIAESEKTAVIASIFLPEFIWLATGGRENLNAKNLRVLAGRRISLFPDINCYENWKQKANEIQRVVKCQITVSDILEKHANEDRRKAGLDIADYLLSIDEKE